MKKTLLAGIALLAAGTMSAQTILEEGFETGNTGKDLTPVAAGPGWEVVKGYKGSEATYNWYNYYSKPGTSPDGTEIKSTITGLCCASVTCPITADSPEKGSGPREEILLTPELDLNDTYELGFTFRVSPMNAYDRSRYDLQVRVVEDGNLEGAETIFSIQNEKMLRESGIGVFPITNWNPYSPKVSLADFKGSKVRLAFVYKLMTEEGNLVWLDDVTVKKFTPATTPQPRLSTNSFNYGDVYIGEKSYSDVISLTNTGTDGLTIESVDMPQGVSLTFSPSDVNLGRYESLDFQVAYSAAMTTPAKGDVVFHTNGGDVTLALSATKKAVPEGGMFEGFEAYYPPAGWKSEGWNWTTRPIEGDHSVYCDGGYSNSYLTSPRLDLTNGGTVAFTYYNNYDGDEAPYYDIEMQVSYDGGKSWKKKWVTEDKNLNQMLTTEVELDKGGDNCYVRWYYPIVETDDYGAMEHTIFTLDRVVLPSVYGINGAPGAVSNPVPANNATDILPTNIHLAWAPAQFAKGYKVFVGTNAEANDLVNGQDVGGKLFFDIPVAKNETSYNWRVVAYNDNGESTDVTTWKFTTQKDASVTSYPYEENFTSLTGNEIPTGWENTPSQNYKRTWSVNSMNPYKNDGKEYAVLSTMWLESGDSNAIATQEFRLPDDSAMEISFIWGDAHPSDLKIDPTGMAEKKNVEPNNGVANNTFDIFADGKWTTLSTISQNADSDDKKFWINEQIDLSAYKGKTVRFRWTHESVNRNKDNGAALTHIVVEEKQGQKAIVNISTWDFGKVNHRMAASSGDVFRLLNKGSETLKVADVSFKQSNFTTTLAKGDEVKPGEAKTFALRFDALEAATTEPVEINDALTINFGAGSIEIPVKGVALPGDTRYYSFEPNTLDHEWNNDFSMIDEDKGVNYNFSSYWVHYNAGGLKGAFSVESDSKEDGLYGMMKPVSGMYALVGASPVNRGADNWLISQKLKASDSAKFDFWARNLECLQSVLPSAKHRIEVLVSTAGNENTADFTTVLKNQEIPYLDADNWKHYEVDLGEYAGKEIYIALRHTTSEATNLAFFDDLCFSGFEFDPSGVKCIEEINDDTLVNIYTIAGVKVAEGQASEAVKALAPGLYIVKGSNGAARRILISAGK